MKYIIVDTFENENFYNAYVADDYKNDFLEIEQGLSLSGLCQTLKQFKEEYGTNKAEFVYYDNEEREIERTQIIL